MNRDKTISALVNCERIDFQLTNKPFFAAHARRGVLLAELEQRLQNLESAIVNETIDARAINSALLFANQVECTLAAAEDAERKADRSVLPGGYGTGLRKIIAQRAEQALIPGSAVSLDALAEEQAAGIRAAVEAKATAVCEAARVSLEALSDDDLRARAARMADLLEELT